MTVTFIYETMAVGVVARGRVGRYSTVLYGLGLALECTYLSRYVKVKLTEIKSEVGQVGREAGWWWWVEM